MKIVAGEREDPNMPLLRGMAIGRSFREAREAKQRAALDREQEDRLQMKALLDFQQESAKVRREEAKALEKYNQGSRDAKALAAASSMMERWKSDPRLRAKMERGQVASKALRGLADRGVSEDTLQRILGHLKTYEADVEKQDEMTAAQEYLQRGHADGHLSDEDFQAGQAFLQTGGNPSVLIGKTIERRHKNAAGEAIKKSNMAALEQAAQIIQTMPPGRERDLAEARYHEAASDSKEMESEGAGARLKHDIQVISLGNADQYAANKKARTEQFMSQPAFGLGGMTRGEMQSEVSKEPVGIKRGYVTGDEYALPFTTPQIPELDDQYSAYAQGLKAEKERRYPPSDPRLGPLPTGYSIDFQSGAAPQPGPAQMPNVDDLMAEAARRGEDLSDPDVLAKWKAYAASLGQ